MTSRNHLLRLPLSIALAVLLVTGPSAAETDAVPVADAEPGLRPTLLVQLAVSDLDEAIRFYRDVLGLELESRDDSLRWARIRTGIAGVTVGLGEKPDVQGSGSVSLNFGVEDVEIARGVLERRGVEFKGETITVPGVVRLADLEDPDGNKIRLAGHPDVRKTAHTLEPGPESRRPPARVEDLAWIAGRWRGEALGGVAEETWNPALGGAMAGTFRLVRDGEVVFYELMTLVEESGSLTLRLKHFNADLTGWEEKDESMSFPLVRLGHHEAWFDGLTMRRPDPDTLEIYVAVSQGGGAPRELAFRLRRAG